MISVVIPVFNEERSVKVLYDRLVSVLKRPYEIIFVDDGSTDGTYKALCSLKGVTIIKFRKNFGQTAALSAGFSHARGDVVVSLDSDLQNDPADIPKLVKGLDRFDVVCGWRHKRKDPLAKRLFSRLASAFRDILVRDPVHDSGCTLRAYRKEALEGLELLGEMHRYIPAILRWRGFRIGEMKVRHYPRRYGKTKYDYKRLVKGLLDLFNVWFWRKFSGRPLHIFGGLGLLSLLAGAVFALYSLYMKIFHSWDLSETFLPVAALFLVIVGIQFFVSGILADISIKNYYQDHDAYNIEKVVRR